METKTILLFALFTLCQGSETFDNVLTDSDICGRNCSELFNPSGPVGECMRGCRFHVIEEFVASDLNASQVNNGCYGACGEAYGENSTRTDACKKGCDFQQKFVANSNKKVTDEGPSIHLLSPLMQVHAVYSSFVGAVHIIRSSLVTYFVSDDNSIIAVESEPEIVLGIDPEAAAAAENRELKAQQQHSRQLEMSNESEEPSIVKCVSRQIGVPPYILVVSVVALVVFTLYVIIAICSTNNPSKAKAFASGKNMHIDPMPLPVKLVRPEDLTKLSLTEEEDLQAPPLPSKVKLPDTLI